MPSSLRDAELADRVRASVERLGSIRDVLGIMALIQNALGRDDGIWWFTELYRQVTVAVQTRCQERFFHDPKWVEALVVDFAKRYFQALGAWLEGNRRDCPASWRVFFRKRFVAQKPGYSPLQCALAGVNAHIQRDLGFAAWTVCERFGLPFSVGTPVYGDYVRINDILDEVEVGAMRMMATGWIKRASALVDPWDRRAAMRLIRASRWLAWRTADAYRRLAAWSPRWASLWLRCLDAYGWACGSVLLLPSFSHGPLLP